MFIYGTCPRDERNVSISFRLGEVDWRGPEVEYGPYMVRIRVW